MLTSTKLHLGCGKTILPEWINLDCVPLAGVDIVFDLNQCEKTPLPLPDDSIEEIWGSHLLEHIATPLPLMQELYRIARPDARATFLVPYGSSDDAAEDPTHVRFYYLNSCGYFSQPYYWRADYGYRGDWLTEKITLKVSKETYAAALFADILHDVMSLRNVVLEMSVELRAVKPVRPPLRELQTRPPLAFALV